MLQKVNRQIVILWSWYTNRWIKKQKRTKKYDTTRSRVAWLLFFTRCDVFCDLLQYTHMEKCYLFVLYNKNSNGLLKDFGAWKKKNKTADLTWIWRHLCVSFNRSWSTINENALYYCTLKWQAFFSINGECSNFVMCIKVARYRTSHFFSHEWEST